MSPDLQPPPAPETRAQLEALRQAFPDYAVGLIRKGDRTRFEAVSRNGGNPYCLISDDAREIWRELRNQ
jgi:hypothetical protein